MNAKLAVVLSSLAITACATTKAGKQTAQVEQRFPSETALQEVAARPAPQIDAAKLRVPANIATWTIAQPSPTRTGGDAPSADDPHAPVFAQMLHAAGAKQTISAQAQCTAREVARFVAQHAASPPLDIAEFMAARCGMTDLAHWWWRTSAAEAGLDPRDDVSNILASAADHARVGAWSEPSASGSATAFVVGRAQIDIEPIEMAGAAQAHVDVRGSLGYRPEWMVAVATRGALGTADCAPIPGEAVVPPAFAWRCPVDRADAAARIDIVAAPRGRLLGEIVGAVFVSPDGSMPTTYAADVGTLPVDPADHGGASYTEAINALRQRAGSAPLRLSEPQSEISTGLLPHLLGARVGSDHTLADRIALGILAGWQVEGAVASGEVGFADGHVEWTVPRTLAALMARPSARGTLMEPERDWLALSTHEHAEARLRLVGYASYEVFEDRDHSAEEAAVVAVLDGIRAEAGLPPVIRVTADHDVQVLRESAGRLREGGDPQAELDKLMQHFVEATQRSFAGTILFPMRIDGWTPEFPAELTQTEHLAMAIAIGFWDPPGLAWGQHAVMIVYTKLDGAPS